MPFSSAIAPSLRPAFSALLCLSLLTPPAPARDHGQQQPPLRQPVPQAPAQSPRPLPQASPTPEPPLDASDEIIRVNADLVQTDVMVFDRQGRFVDNLQRDQFELRVDGRPQTVSFFEQVQAGTARDDARLAATPGAPRPGASPAAEEARPSDRGRTVLFFLDDFHLASDSLARARRAVTSFVENEMGENDQVAVASASGQVGFLQQLTGHKAVLRAAISRLNNRQRRIIDMEQPPMTENQAFVIDEGTDPAVLEWFMSTSRRNPAASSAGEAEVIRTRARQIVAQSSAVTANTLAALEGLVRSSARLPGRKVVFFVSDGFYISFRNSATAERLRRITDAGARAGVVIYTTDARGLATQPSFDASREPQPDLSGALTRSNATEVISSQEPLHTLAADTGGRALLNTNALDAAIPRALRETSRYYLLAWTPEERGQRGRRFRRIEVGIKDRPDLTVRVRRGFYDAPPPEPSRSGARAQAANSPEAALLSAVRSASPARALPTHLSLGYLDTAEAGPVLTATTQLDTAALDFNAGAAPQAVVDVVSVVYDDQGTVKHSAKQRLTVTPPAGATAADGAPSRPFIFNQQYRLTPGLYQVRVAARDSKTGLLGSAAEWVEIPNVRGGAFALSSIFVGERPPAAAGPRGPAATSAPEIVVNAAHRFGRASTLPLFLYIYNAMHAAAPPDVALQVRIFRNARPVVSSPLSRVSVDGVTDLARIPYAAEISLKGMPSGRYTLQVTAVDRKAGTSSSQRVNFEIE